MNTIQSEWDDLKKIFGNLQKWQLDEMEAIFYTGAAAILNIMIRISRDDNVSEIEGKEIFEGMRQECADFFHNKIMK